MRTKIEKTLASVKKNVPLIPNLRSVDDEYDRAISSWSSSCGDFGDALTVAQATECLRPLCFLSDDADLATFQGITLYTANQRIINDAVASGMLR